MLPFACQQGYLRNPCSHSPAPAAETSGSTGDYGCGTFVLIVAEGVID